MKKKELSQKINRIQKSTKTFFPRYMPLHDKLRRSSKLYYKWHTIPYISVFHWAVLLVATLWFFYFLASSISLYQASTISKGYCLNGGTALSKEAEFLGTVLEENRIMLEKEGPGRKAVGVYRKRCFNQSHEVSWNSISWEVQVPKNTKVSFRIRQSYDGDGKVWRDSDWSGYYEATVTSGAATLSQQKAKNVELEILLEGDKLQTPEIKAFKLTYIHPQEVGPVKRFIQEKIRKYLPRLWKTLEERYGNDIQY